MHSNKHNKNQDRPTVRHHSRTPLEGYLFLEQEAAKSARQARKMLEKIALSEEEEKHNSTQELPKTEEVTHRRGSFSSLKEMFTNKAASVLKRKSVSSQEGKEDATHLNQSTYNTWPQTSSSSRPKVELQNESIYEEIDEDLKEQIQGLNKQVQNTTSSTLLDAKLDRRARDEITKERLQKIKDSLPRSSSRG